MVLIGFFFFFNWFVIIFLKVLPQLRSTTSMELGCDARGYSRAGYDKVTWYCAILVGRQSVELNKMREVSKIFFQHRPFLSEVLVSFLIRVLSNLTSL
jgi:hypothetical protein